MTRFAVVAALVIPLMGVAPIALEATGVTPSTSASAHDKAADVTCTAATVSLKNYDKDATAKVTLDNVVKFDGKIPGSGYTLNETLNGTVNHTLIVTVRSNDGSQYNMDFSKTTTGCAPVVAPPTQTVTCDVISGNYNRPLTNGDHINATITPPGTQVNMYVDQNITGGASYNGQNNLGLRWKILGVDQTPIPLTLDQIKAGIITLPYGAKLTQSSWTVSFVQTNETDTWPEFKCNRDKEDAVATVSVKTAATCFSSSTVVATVTNAQQVRDGVVKNDVVLDQSVGTHTADFQANVGSLFAGGGNTITVTYTIYAADPSLCPQDASASVKIDQQETCLADTTVKFDLAHATWDAEADLSVGTHTRTATAEKDHLFPGGKSTLEVSYTIKAADPALCPQDASASFSIDKAATCTTGTDVSFGLSHAKWDTEADLSVGTHTRNATADAGFNFPNGTKHISVTYTIEAADPSLCPQDASASVKTDQQETCLADSTVVFTLANATWDDEADLTVGTHARTATAEKDHLFPGGLDTITVTYTIKAADPALCPQDASASASVGTAATCLADSTVVFTLANATWDTVTPDLTVGTHTRTATANENHLFPGGKSTLEVSYTITKADPSLCPGKATASASVGTAATCLASSVPDFTIMNATWDEDADLTVGTHTRTATAKDGFLFPSDATGVETGKTTITVTYTVVAADPSLCPKDATALVSIDKAATCTTSETVKITTVNATLVGVLDQTVGTHKATVNAVVGHLFPDGTSQATVSYTVKDKRVCDVPAILASTGVSIGDSLIAVFVLLLAGTTILIVARKRHNKGTGTI